MQQLKPYIELNDVRGSFMGIINELDWKEMNYIKTFKGSIRGGHYHAYTKELFFIISGQIKVTIQNINTNEEKIYELKGHDIFLVDPFCMHTFECLTDCEWINLLSDKMDQNDMHKL